MNAETKIKEFIKNHGRVSIDIYDRGKLIETYNTNSAHDAIECYEYHQLMPTECRVVRPH